MDRSDYSQLNGSQSPITDDRSSKDGINRRCRKVYPMVMGHVLQPPKLTLPKMNPESLRAIARENRQIGNVGDKLLVLLY